LESLAQDSALLLFQRLMDDVLDARTVSRAVARMMWRPPRTRALSGTLAELSTPLNVSSTRRPDSLIERMAEW